MLYETETWTKADKHLKKLLSTKIDYQRSAWKSKQEEAQTLK